MQPGEYGEGYRETTERMTVAEAADRLQVSKEAVRQRIRRGTLRSDKDNDGRVMVYVTADATGVSGEGYGEPYADATALLREKDAHIQDLREQLAAERESNRENRRLLAAALERFPAAIEASPGEETFTGGREPAGSHEAPHEPTSGQSRGGFLRRIFGGGRP